MATVSIFVFCHSIVFEELPLFIGHSWFKCSASKVKGGIEQQTLAIWFARFRKELPL